MPPASEQVEVQRSNDDHQNVRAICKNNVAVSALMLVDPRSRMRCRAFYILPSVWRKWYQRQSKELRSVEEAAAWLLEMVQTGFQKCFAESWMQLLSGDTLGKLGLDVYVYRNLDGMDDCHPLVLEQDDTARFAGNFLCRFLSHRDRRLMAYTEGWLGRQALLFSPDEAEQKKKTSRNSRNSTWLMRT